MNLPKSKKFFETEEFKRLNDEWAKKLKDSGFKDIENKDETLKEPNTRTIAFQNRDKILDFHLKLSSYLNSRAKIPDDHRKILELYNNGVYITGVNSIVEQTGYSKRGVLYLLKRYKKKILGK